MFSLSPSAAASRKAADVGASSLALLSEVSFWVEGQGMRDWDVRGRLWFEEAELKALGLTKDGLCGVKFSQT